MISINLICVQLWRKFGGFGSSCSNIPIRQPEDHVCKECIWRQVTIHSPTVWNIVIDIYILDFWILIWWLIDEWWCSSSPYGFFHISIWTSISHAIYALSHFYSLNMMHIASEIVCIDLHVYSCLPCLTFSSFSKLLTFLILQKILYLAVAPPRPQH